MLFSEKRHGCFPVFLGEREDGALNPPSHIPMLRLYVNSKKSLHWLNHALNIPKSCQPQII